MDRLHRILEWLRVRRRSRPERALGLFHRGVQASERGHHAHAVKMFTRALDLSPATSQLHHHRGAALAELGRIHEAIVDYDTAARLSPAYPDTYLDRGNSRHILGEVDKAIRDFAEAIRLRPDWAEAYANRAVAHRQAGNGSASAADAMRARDLGVDGARLEELLQAADEVREQVREEPGQD